MPNKERAKWRKNRIAEMDDGSGAVTDLTLKKAVDVINSVMEDLTASIENSSKSNKTLSIVIAVATVILASVGIA
ncbi:MAG: hypothetical protein JRI71_04520 [Deltaproteobacteria bacterium]|nr:hypothetical protein [Deltaproteobacteria bacterium]MBW2309592.1 hypothetical protein [Deltaproteobacteria bacterium]